MILCASAPLREICSALFFLCGLIFVGSSQAVSQDQPAAGSLSDVHAAMKQAQQRLEAGDTGPLTQEQQAAAAEMLAALIEAAKARESSSQSSGSGGGQGQQKGQNDQSASQSQSQGSPGENAGAGSKQQGERPAERVERGAPQSPWSKLRDRERDPVYSAIKERFPARYQQLLEQYYKSFQDDKKP
jgi:hypothetical protein